MTDLRLNRWQLPDGVNELLPKDAWRVESLRRRIMDNACRWGYELVMPPMIEYLESLLTGSGKTLDLQTFKIIDQHNGRTLGIRADMTPQVARMDAHALSSDLPNRLFYTGSALRARSDGAGSSRTPLQFGAELFGHSGPASDSEIIQLMLDSVELSGLNTQNVILDVGHVGVYRALIETANLPDDLEQRLYDSLVRGSIPEVLEILDDWGNTPSAAVLRAHIEHLMRASGTFSAVLKSAREQLGNDNQGVSRALDNLESVVQSVLTIYPSLNVHADLAELRGYSYHTGILFTLYDESGGELARGGRYDAIGEAFGRTRAATGFSGDLVNLCMASQSEVHQYAAESQGIWVECRPDVDTQMFDEIKSLRASGHRVVMALPDSRLSADLCRCDKKLVKSEDGRWLVASLV